MYIRCQDPLYYSTLRCYMQTCHANRRICCKRKSAFPSLRSMKPAVTFNLLVLLLLLNRNSLGSYRNFQSSHMMSTFFIVIVMIKECLLLISDQLKCIKKEETSLLNQAERNAHLHSHALGLILHQTCFLECRRKTNGGSFICSAVTAHCPRSILKFNFYFSYA